MAHAAAGANFDDGMPGLEAGMAGQGGNVSGDTRVGMFVRRRGHAFAADILQEAASG